MEIRELLIIWAWNGLNRIWRLKEVVMRPQPFHKFCGQYLIDMYSSECMEAHRLDYQPLFGKGARAPPLIFSGRVDQTWESGGNRA